MWTPLRQNQSWVSEFILLGFSSDPTFNRILFISFLLLYLSSVLGNGLIIILICLDMQLHTPMYFFLCILFLLDMGCVTTTMPQILVHLLAHSQTISFAGCWLQMYVFGALGLTVFSSKSWLMTDMWPSATHCIILSSSAGACAHGWQLGPGPVVSSSL